MSVRAHIVLRVEQLVLDGVPRNAASALQEALTRALERRLTTPGALERMRAMHGTARIDGGSVRLGAAGRAEDVGVRAGRRIAERLT